MNSMDHYNVDWEGVAARHETRAVILSALSRHLERKRITQFAVATYTTWKELFAAEGAEMHGACIDEFHKFSHGLQDVLHEVTLRLDPSLEGHVRAALDAHWPTANGAVLLCEDQRARLAFFRVCE